MIAVYNGKKYYVSRGLSDNNSIVLTSHSKEEGFSNYVDYWGEEHNDFFSKKVQMDELDYLYKIRYEIQYKGHFFPVSSAMNRMNVKDDWFEIKPGFKQGQLGIDLGFKQINKMEWAKELHRSDIEKLKVIEEPLGIFINQGLKITIYEDGDIDTFLKTLR